MEAPRLLDVFETVLVPDAVWIEATQPGRTPAPTLRRIERLKRHRNPPPSGTKRRFEHLHAGERACLHLCEHKSIQLLLTDDLAARESAKQEGITPVGSLGIVLRACREGHLTQHDAERLLHLLHDDSSLFVTRSLIEYAIDRLRRAF